MNTPLTVIGIVLIVVGAVFTVFTFGIGIICTWPLILVGFILLIVGIILPESTSRSEPPMHQAHERRCPACGRVIPFDAKVCPYCKKDFEVNESKDTGK